MKADFFLDNSRSPGTGTMFASITSDLFLFKAACSAEGSTSRVGLGGLNLA